MSLFTKADRRRLADIEIKYGMRDLRKAFHLRCGLTEPQASRYADEETFRLLPWLNDVAFDRERREHERRDLLDLLCLRALRVVLDHGAYIRTDSPANDADRSVLATYLTFDWRPAGGPAAAPACAPVPITPLGSPASATSSETSSDIGIFKSCAQTAGLSTYVGDGSTAATATALPAPTSSPNGNEVPAQAELATRNTTKQPVIPAATPADAVVAGLSLSNQNDNDAAAGPDPRPFPTLAAAHSSGAGHTQECGTKPNTATLGSLVGSDPVSPPSSTQPSSSSLQGGSVSGGSVNGNPVSTHVAVPVGTQRASLASDIEAPPAAAAVVTATAAAAKATPTASATKAPSADEELIAQAPPATGPTIVQQITAPRDAHSDLTQNAESQHHTPTETVQEPSNVLATNKDPPGPATSHTIPWPDASPEAVKSEVDVEHSLDSASSPVGAQRAGFTSAPKARSIHSTEPGSTLPVTTIWPNHARFCKSPRNVDAKRLTADELSIHKPFIAKGVKSNNMLPVAVLASSRNFESLSLIDKGTVPTLQDHHAYKHLSFNGHPKLPADVQRHAARTAVAEDIPRFAEKSDVEIFSDWDAARMRGGYSYHQGPTTAQLETCARVDNSQNPQIVDWGPAGFRFNISNEPPAAEVPCSLWSEPVCLETNCNKMDNATFAMEHAHADASHDETAVKLTFIDASFPVNLLRPTAEKQGSDIQALADGTENPEWRNTSVGFRMAKLDDIHNSILIDGSHPTNADFKRLGFEGICTLLQRTDSGPPSAITSNRGEVVQIAVHVGRGEELIRYLQTPPDVPNTDTDYVYCLADGEYCDVELYRAAELLLTNFSYYALLAATFGVLYVGRVPGVEPICVAEHLAGHLFASTGGVQAVDPILAAPESSTAILTIA